MTIKDRAPAVGDCLRIPGGSAVATVMVVRVGLQGNSIDTFIDSPRQWNLDLEHFRAKHGRQCLKGEAEYVEEPTQ